MQYYFCVICIGHLCILKNIFLIDHSKTLRIRQKLLKFLQHLPQTMMLGVVRLLRSRSRWLDDKVKLRSEQLSCADDASCIATVHVHFAMMFCVKLIKCICITFCNFLLLVQQRKMKGKMLNTLWNREWVIVSNTQNTVMVC